jgi:hypothetical protein
MSGSAWWLPCGDPGGHCQPDLGDDTDPAVGVSADWCDGDVDEVVVGGGDDDPVNGARLSAGFAGSRVGDLVAHLHVIDRLPRAVGARPLHRRTWMKPCLFSRLRTLILAVVADYRRSCRLNFGRPPGQS